MFQRLVAVRRYLLAGGVALVLGLVSTVSAAEPPADSYGFRAPGTAAPAPGHPVASPSDKDKEGWSFHSPIPNFDSSSGPGRLNTGAKGSGFGTPKDAVALASKPGCKTGGG